MGGGRDGRLAGPLLLRGCQVLLSQRRVRLSVAKFASPRASPSDRRTRVACRPTRPRRSDCLLDWEYEHDDPGFTYDEASAWCAARGATLASIEDAAEQELATQACQPTTANVWDACWLGLNEVGGDETTDRTDQVWAWSDGGVASYRSWAEDDSNNHAGVDERNAVTWWGTWYDIHADTKGPMPLCSDACAGKKKKQCNKGSCAWDKKAKTCATSSGDACSELPKKTCNKTDGCEYKKKQCSQKPSVECSGLKKRKCKKEKGACKYKKRTKKCVAK